MSGLQESFAVSLWQRPPGAYRTKVLVPL